MNKNPKVDFHIKADKTKLDKAKKLSGFTNREIFELGCQFVIENNQNRLDAEIMELHDAINTVNELTESIKCKLKDKEVPTEPGPGSNDEKEIKRNILPLELFKEMVLYYMDDYDITNINDLNMKNKKIFRFVLINLAHHDLTIGDINDLYNSK
jgi:hypothetical protein